jgi:hypothetical protein
MFLSLSQLGWSIRNIDLTEDWRYVALFIELSQPFYSIWNCLLDIDYGAHEFTSDVLEQDFKPDNYIFCVKMCVDKEFICI